MGPDRIERRQGRVTELTRDRDGLKGRILKTVPRERRSESHLLQEGDRGREPGIRHTKKQERRGVVSGKSARLEGEEGERKMSREDQRRQKRE